MPLLLRRMTLGAALAGALCAAAWAKDPVTVAGAASAKTAPSGRPVPWEFKIVVGAQMLEGGLLPPNYKEIVTYEIKTGLRDPYSAHISIAAPVGSLVCGLVNSKNSYGGYTGQEPWFAVFDKEGRSTRTYILRWKWLPNIVWASKHPSSIVWTSKHPRFSINTNFVIATAIEACGFLPKSFLKPAPRFDGLPGQR